MAEEYFVDCDQGLWSGLFAKGSALSLANLACLSGWLAGEVKTWVPSRSYINTGSHEWQFSLYEESPIYLQLSKRQGKELAKGVFVLWLKSRSIT